MRFIVKALILALLYLTSCKNSEDNKWSDLPTVTDITTLQHTEVVPTLENPISKNKNVIYATSFLYAWDKVKEQLNGSILLTDKNSFTFRLINRSTSYKNTLLPTEYSADIDVIDSVIIAKSFFNKTLPFPTKLQKADQPITFNKTRVSAFGLYSNDEDAIKFTEILHYIDDDHFILKLTPKDNEHQILLAKGLENATTLMAALGKINDLIVAGAKERDLPGAVSRYTMNRNDIISIPSIQFNIEMNYRDVEGHYFSTNRKPYRVEVAYQRTGFILNEKGAVVESETYAVTDTAEPTKVLPKRMIFDKPFFVIVKRTNSENPYFVLYVQNSELLTKEVQ
jgi:hypothetical protein